MLRVHLDGADFTNANLENATIDSETYKKYKTYFMKANNLDKIVIESG